MWRSTAKFIHSIQDESLAASSDVNPQEVNDYLLELEADVDGSTATNTK